MKKRKQRQEEIDKCFQINTAAALFKQFMFIENPEDEKYVRGKRHRVFYLKLGFSIL